MNVNGAFLTFVTRQHHCIPIHDWILNVQKHNCGSQIVKSNKIRQKSV